MALSPGKYDDLTTLAENLAAAHGVVIVPNRIWWARVYRAGIHADLVKAPRVPPRHLTAEQKAVWLAGYDR